MNYEWVSELIGIPYLEGGCDLDAGLDCYGLTRVVMKRAKNLDLPERPMGWRRFGKVLPTMMPILPFDLLFFSDDPLGLVNHVGVALDEKEFIHTTSHHGGVVRELISRYRNRLLAIGRANDH